LLDDLEQLDVASGEIHISGQLYDSLLTDAEESVEEKPEDEE